MTDSKNSKFNLEKLARIEIRLGKRYNDLFKIVINKKSLIKTFFKSDAVIQNIFSEYN
jgi:hypothetical protein